MQYERKNRLWFAPEQLHTDAWRKIVRHSQSSLEQELREILLDIMREQRLDILKYDLTALVELCDRLKLSARLRCAITRSDIRQILHGWGMEACKKAARFTYYLRDSASGASYSCPRIGKVIKISKKQLSENDF